MTLVLTTDVGVANSTIDLSTPAQGTARFITATLVPTPALPTIVSQIGWVATANSNLLALLPAGHVPGMYEVLLVLVVRTGGSAVGTTAIATWNSPIFGAEGKTLGLQMVTSAIGTSVAVTGTLATPLRSAPIMSDGTAPITLQMLATGAASTVDIYACARLAAQ